MLTATSSILRSLWRNRRLWWQFTKRQVELRHKGSHLGLFWSILSPLLMLGLYVMVFGFIFKGRFQGASQETRLEYALTIFLGLAILHCASEILASAPLVILSNPNFVKKVVFPLEILPAANLGAATVHFGITLALVFIGLIGAGIHLSAQVLWLPVILAPFLVIGLGFSLGISALGVFWRDLAQITQFFILVLMFASAVFYPVTQVQGFAWTVLKFNPLLHVVEEARGAVLWGRAPNLRHVGYLYAVGGSSIILGSFIFQRLRSSFADVL